MKLHYSYNGMGHIFDNSELIEDPYISLVGRKNLRETEYFYKGSN